MIAGFGVWKWYMGGKKLKLKNKKPGIGENERYDPK